jgi:hypothetical protein
VRERFHGDGPAVEIRRAHVYRVQGYREIARPFEWIFTRHDLNRVLAKIAGREPKLRLAA